MIKERCWFSQIDFFIEYFPHRINVLFLSSQFGVIHTPYWTMILAICVVVDESKCLDIPIWEFSIICEHLPFLLGYQQILRQLLILRNPAIWR